MKTTKWCAPCQGVRVNADNFCWSCGCKLTLVGNVCSACGREEDHISIPPDKYCRDCGGKMQIRGA